MSKCGCGRSPTGMCKGWHGLSQEEFEAKLAEYKSKETSQQYQLIESEVKGLEDPCDYFESEGRVCSHPLKYAYPEGDKRV